MHLSCHYGHWILQGVLVRACSQFSQCFFLNVCALQMWVLRLDLGEEPFAFRPWKQPFHGFVEQILSAFFSFVLFRFYSSIMTKPECSQNGTNIVPIVSNSDAVIHELLAPRLGDRFNGPKILDCALALLGGQESVANTLPCHLATKITKCY